MSANPYEPSSTTAAPSAVSPTEHEDQLASRLARLVAAIVDGFLTRFIVESIGFATGYTQPAKAQQASFAEHVLATSLAVVVALSLHGYLLVNRGQTIGKMLTGIQIVDVNTIGIIPLARAFVYRHLWALPLILAALASGTQHLHSATVVLVFVDILFIFGASRRCLHDRFAGSKVVLYREGRPRVA